MVLAVQADGAKITTVEGLAQDGAYHPIQQAFWDLHGLQCGFCTPGLLMAAVGLLERNPRSQRRGDPRAARGQPLPLHWLPEHRRRGARRRREDAASATAVARASGLWRAANSATEEERTAWRVTRLFGASVKRREDPRLITGKGAFTDDFKLPGMAYMAVLRSPYGHARITRLDTTQARAHAWRRRRLHRQDLEGKLNPIPCAWLIPDSDLKTPAYRALAIG